MSQFIKDIFLPEKIKSYYLFSKTVVGIEVNKTNIIATKTRIAGNTSVIETIIEEKIPEEVSEENLEKTSPALQSIFSKIGMVIGFEIEPLLPFALRDAVIDFIITREIPEEKSSEIMVTAVQKQHIVQHVAMFEAI